MSYSKPLQFSLLEVLIYLFLSTIVFSSIFLSLYQSSQSLKHIYKRHAKAYESLQFQSDIEKLFFFSIPDHIDSFHSFKTSHHFPDFYPSSSPCQLQVKLQHKYQSIYLDIQNEKGVKISKKYFKKVSAIEIFQDKYSLEILISFNDNTQLPFLFFKQNYFEEALK